MRQVKSGPAYGSWLLLLAGFCLWQAVAAQDFIVAVEESDNHPFEYVQGDGTTHGGFHLEVIDEVAARLGWHVVYKPMPWQRALRSLQLGKVDALSYLARTPERDAYAVFVPAAIQHRQYAGLFVRRSQRQRFPESARPCSYAAYHIAAASNYFYGDIVQQAMHECWQLDLTASSKEEVFSKLLAGRIDIAVAYGTSLQSLETHMPELQSQVVALREPRWLIGDFYLGFSRKAMSAQRIDAYVGALGGFRQSPAYQQLVRKYNMKSFLP